MKKSFLLVLLSTSLASFSQLGNPSLGAGVAYSNIMDMRSEVIYGTPGITLRASGDIASRHILMGGFSYYLPMVHSYTATASPKANASTNYTIHYMNFSYKSKTEATELFLEIVNLVGNTTEDKVAFYFHTGFNTYFFKHTNTYENLDTLNFTTPIKEGKTKVGAFYVYVGPGMQFRLGTGYLFFEAKASIPIPIGNLYSKYFNMPVGFNLGYRMSFED